jgi:hypothetical protein
MEEGKRVRVIKPADKEHKTKNVGRQTVIDKEDMMAMFLALKKEHGRDISVNTLQHTFGKNPYNFQRFLAEQLNYDFNDDGIDGIIGPKTAIDVSRINYIHDMNDIKPELSDSVPGLNFNANAMTDVTRDTDKNTMYGTSKNTPPLDMRNKIPRIKRKKKLPVRKYKS